MTTTHDDKARGQEDFEQWAGMFPRLTERDRAAAWEAWLARAALPPASTGQEAESAAKKIMRDLSGRRGILDDIDDDVLDEISASIRAIIADEFAAPAQQVEAEKWISVTERLPELGVPVLVAVHWVKFREDEDGRPFEQFGVDVTEGQYRYSEHGSYMESFTGPHGDSADHITHWMPLPKPPAAGSINGEKG